MKPISRRLVFDNFKDLYYKMFFRITDRYYTVRAQLTRQCANIVLLVQISLALDFADSGNRTQML